MQKKQKIIMVLGPTASGKTKFGVALAAALNGEVIGADSRQVYRGLDIGSGKDLAEYTLPDGTDVPYHLIDVAEPDEEYTLADFLSDADRAIDDICERGKVPVIVGGTALYLHGLLQTYQLHGGAPDKAERTELRSLDTETLRKMLLELDPESPIPQKEPENRVRLIRAIEQVRGGEVRKEPVLPQNREYLIFGTLRDRKDVHARIAARLQERLEKENMLDEGRFLHDEKGVSYERLEFLGLEYRYMALCLQNKITEAEMKEQLLAKIRQFAKRQDSWFRKLERDGFSIYWMPPEQTADAVRIAELFLHDKTDSLPPVTVRLSEIKYGTTGGSGK